MNRRGFMLGLIALPLSKRVDTPRKYIVRRSGYRRLSQEEQRMYNYWCSQTVEMIALSPKRPFIA